MKNEKVVFANGCFWCTEAIFKRVKGVESIMPGYAGGTVPNPTYEQVCNGNTGYAEAIQIEYDPKEISYEELLVIFFATHDPTTLNRQGNDVGTQYRSAIFFSNEEEKTIATKLIDKLTADKLFDDPIVTTLEPLEKFYPAEKYHHDYYDQNITQPYCQFVISPKIKKFKEKFADKMKKE